MWVRAYSAFWVAIILVAALLIVIYCGGCAGMGFDPTPHLTRGMTGDEVDHHCVADCFPIFQLVGVGLHGDELVKTYRQAPAVGDGLGQLLIVTERNGEVTDWTLLGGYGAVVPSSSRNP